MAEGAELELGYSVRSQGGPSLARVVMEGTAHAGAWRAWQEVVVTGAGVLWAEGGGGAAIP